VFLSARVDTSIAARSSSEKAARVLATDIRRFKPRSAMSASIAHCEVRSFASTRIAPPLTSSP
jgi:hypothetical protein